MGTEGTRARSHAHGRRHGRNTVHVLIVAMAVFAVIFAAKFPNESQAIAPLDIPSFALSGVTGASISPDYAYFRPGPSHQTFDSIAQQSLRAETLTVRAAGGLSPTSALSSGVAVAASNSGEIGAGVKPLADIVDPRSPIVEYRAMPGDSISGVAAKFGITVETLLDNNKTVDDRDLLELGQTLVVPRKDGILHKVGFGETVSKIVAQYDNITADTVIGYKPNAIGDPGALESGKYLLLVGAVPKPPAPAPPPPVRSQPSGGTTTGGGATTGGGTITGSGTARPAAGGIFTAYPLAAHNGVSDPFGIGRGAGRIHEGIDLQLYALPRSNVFSACDGTVTRVEYLTYSYGYYVIVDCGGGWTTLYAHMSQINVVQGQPVSAGTVVGVSGSTGFSTGEHLHFEIRFNGGPVNPANYLDF